jgi:hypothetical protein
MEKQIQEVMGTDPYREWESLGAIEIKPAKLYLSVCNEAEYEDEDEEELKEPYRDYDDYCYRGKLVGSIGMLAIKLKDYPETELLYPQEKNSYLRLSPSNTVALLKYSLDSRLIQRLIICDYLNEDEAWFKQTTQYKYEADQIAIEAKATALDELTLFRPQSLEKAYEPFDREWLTILKSHSYEAANVFAQIADLEELIITNANLSFEMLDALWCWFGLILLSPLAATPLAVAELNPIRAAVIAKALKARLLTVPGQLKSARHEQMLSRCNYMGESVCTHAESALNNFLVNASPDQTTRIGLILDFLQKTAALYLVATVMWTY